MFCGCNCPHCLWRYAYGDHLYAHQPIPVYDSNNTYDHKEITQEEPEKPLHFVAPELVALFAMIKKRRLQRQNKDHSQAKVKKQTIGQSLQESNEEKVASNLSKERRSKLYGSRLDQVTKLENIIDSEYDQYCDQNKPALWPQLPLNLNLKHNKKGF